MMNTAATDPAANTRVHVVDDDPGLRAALSDLLESLSYDVATYGCAAEFLARAERKAPGCLVLDVRLPGVSGLELQERLVRDGVDLPVILMTSFADVAMSVRGMKAGARDFLEKPFREQDMLDAIADAVDASRRGAPLMRRRDAMAQRYASLTRREREIMELVARGHLSKQIAHALSISEVTVKMHRGGVMRKMQAASVADLGRMAEVLGL
jgi:FixJ family two-component response regulator